MSVEKAELKTIPVEYLQPGRFQPRRVFDEQALQELADSIAATGLIQPVVVRPLSDDHYEIVAGERRWRAVQRLKQDKLLCLVKRFTNEQMAAVSTIENIQREDLNPIEEAKAYQRLIDEFHYLHEEIAAMVGKSRSRITNSLRLLKLDISVQEDLITQQLSEGHGRALAGLAESLQRELADRIIKQGLSVRKVEQIIKQLNQQKTPRAIHGDDTLHVAHLERHLSDKVGCEVKLETDLGQKSGWMKIRYFDNETLAGVIEKLGISVEEV